MTKKTIDSKALRALGVLGLLGIGAAHLELWLGYYQLIPTIGPLFLFTVVFAWVLALVMTAFPRALVAVIAAVFALATLGGYVLALVLPQGIFLFTEQSISYAGGVAIASEAIGAVALLAWAATRLLGARSTTGATRSAAPSGRPQRKAATEPWAPAVAPRSTGPARATGASGGGQLTKGLARLFFGHR